MKRFLLGQAAGNEADKLVELCLEQCGVVPHEASLGFVYGTDVLAGRFADILAALQRRAPQVQWVGTIGLGIATTGREYYDEPALTVLITDIPRQHFHILQRTAESESAIAEARRWCEAQGYFFALLHGDPANPRTPQMIERVAQFAPASFVNGGLTSSNTLNYQIANGIESGGVSGVLFAAEVPVATDHTQGCTPIGPKRRISQAERNVVHLIEERPAFEVMKEDMGEVLAKDLSRIGGYIFVALPIAGSDTGDYLVRNLLALDTREGSIAVGDYLEGHDELIFCRRDGNSAREDMERMLMRLKERVGERTIRGGVYVSCLGRGRHQFGDDSEELKAIGQALGDFPLVGFFANGEVYNGRMYGYTGVLTLFL